MDCLDFLLRIIETMGGFQYPIRNNFNTEKKYILLFSFQVLRVLNGLTLFPREEGLVNFRALLNRKPFSNLYEGTILLLIKCISYIAQDDAYNHLKPLTRIWASAHFKKFPELYLIFLGLIIFIVPCLLKKIEMQGTNQETCKTKKQIILYFLQSKILK